MPNHPIKAGGKFFQYRNGVGGFFWKGMAVKPDMGAQPPDHPRFVLNGRYVGGYIVARPPITTEVAVIPPADTGVYWSPSFLGEHHSYGGVRLWWGWPRTNPISMATSGIAGFLDTDHDIEQYIVAKYTHGFAFTPVVERFSNFIYVGDFGALRRVYRTNLTPAQATGEDARILSPADEVVVTYPGFLTTALHLHEGKLYFALADPTGALNGFIYSWDGFSVVQEYALTVSGNSGVAMQSFRNTLVVTIRGLGSILVRSATGSWSTATVAGFDSSSYMNSMAELEEKLYIVDGGTKIYTWDGTNLTLVRTITVGTTPQNLNCCTVFNGRLYYLWNELVDATAPGYRLGWIGMFDPATVDLTYKYKDDYKRLGPDVWTGTTRPVADVHAAADHPYYYDAIPKAIAVYRQRLVAVFGTSLYTHTQENNPHSLWHAASPAPTAWEVSELEYGPFHVRYPLEEADPPSPEYLKVL